MTSAQHSTPSDNESSTRSTTPESSSASSSISTGPPDYHAHLDDAGRITLTEHGRRAGLADWLGLLGGIDDPNLRLTLRRAHWHLVDPILDAACRYVTEQDAGRHRWDPDEPKADQWHGDVWAASPPKFEGRHALPVGDPCRDDPRFVSIAQAAS